MRKAGAPDSVRSRAESQQGRLRRLAGPIETTFEPAFEPRRATPDEPDSSIDPSQPFWHGFWSNKIRNLRSQGIFVYGGMVTAGGRENGVYVS